MMPQRPGTAAARQLYSSGFIEFDEYTAVSVIDNVLLFQGRRLDGESELYYFRNRQYDPVHGRFLSRDPMGYTDSYCLYQFCNNAPITNVDPEGKCCMTCMPEPVPVTQHTVCSGDVKNSSSYELEGKGDNATGGFFTEIIPPGASSTTQDIDDIRRTDGGTLCGAAGWVRIIGDVYVVDKGACDAAIRNYFYSQVTTPHFLYRLQ